MALIKSIFFFRTLTGNFSYVPVTLEKLPSLDDWDEAMTSRLNKYFANFSVDYDQDYIIKVIVRFRGSIGTISFLQLCRPLRK